MTISSYNSDGQRFVNSYLKAGGDSFEDPDGAEYEFSRYGGEYVDGGVTTSSFNHTIYIVNGTKCSGEIAKWSGRSTDYTIFYKLEGGGVYCLDGSGLQIHIENPSDPPS